MWFVEHRAHAQIAPIEIRRPDLLALVGQHDQFAPAIADAQASDAAIKQKGVDHEVGAVKQQATFFAKHGGAEMKYVTHLDLFSGVDCDLDTVWTIADRERLHMG